MPSNVRYAGPQDLPAVIPVFPLPQALLFPRAQLPLNIFEPRYMAMVDDALKTHRIIGMVQPDPDGAGTSTHPALTSVGCAGRITQLAETGDGRYVLSLHGIARFRVQEELPVLTPYRQCRVSAQMYARDFLPGSGEEAVDRETLLKTLAAYLEANKLEADWEGISKTANEALVNALVMMSPFGAREKQALLEAPDLKSRAELLVAVTEIELAKGGGADGAPLQ